MASWQDRLERTGQDIYRDGNELGNQARGLANESAGRADYYRQLADQFYNDLRDNGGYTPEQIEQIMQSDQFKSLLYSQAEADGAFLNQDEINEIRGNPWAAKDAYNTEGIYGSLGRGINDQRGAWARGSAGVDAATGRLRQDLYGAIDPSIALDETYGARGRGLIEGAQGNRLGVLGSGFETAQELGKNVSLSDRYINAATVGDDEIQGIQDEAARQLRAGNARTIQDAQMRALQGGNANALAVGALQDRLTREGAADEADAAATARMKALDYRRGWEDTMEGRRLGAEQAKAGIGSQGLQFLRDQSDVYGEGMNAGLNLNQSEEGMRQAQLEKLMAARMNAGQVAGQAEIGEAQRNREGAAGIESEIANRDLGVATGDLNARVGLEERGEAAQQERARQIMLNQQGTRQYNSQARYDRNNNLYGTMSGNARGVADAQRQDRQTGAAYTAGQNQFQSQKEDRAQDRQVDIYGRQTSGVNQANSTWAQAKSQPGFWSKLAGAAVGGASALGGLGWKPLAGGS